MKNPATFSDSYQPDFGIPWIPRYSDKMLASLSTDELAEYTKQRLLVEDNALLNPVGAGWILPSWQKVMANWKKYPIIVLLGGNRSSRSTLAARLTVWATATIPQAENRAYHVNEDRSIEQQQFIWEALPPAVRNLPTKKGVYHSLQYSQKNGFTDNVCILPPYPGYRRGGSIKFGNYMQYLQNPQVTEGFKCHTIWLDEEVPAKMFETLIYRTVDYHGRIILTFTTLHGWSPLIQDLIGRTRTLETRWSPLLKRNLPVMQESLSREGTVIYYFWTEDNVFIDTADFIDRMKNRPKDEVLARLYGVPTKSISGAFPAFSKEVHVIAHEKLPWIKDPKYKVTRYMAIDPAGSKNWFMVWEAVDAAGTRWIYDEWPDYDAWAIPGSNAEGKPGPAQKGSRKGIKDYVELIKDKEKGDVVFERFVDPRLGAAEKQSAEGATTIISDMDDQEMTLIPAPGVDIENGLQLIANLLAWDENKPMDSQNSPHLYVSDRCQNVIFALQEYTAKGGPHEATKDPIDGLRYLAVSNCEFLEESKADNTPTGVY